MKQYISSEVKVLSVDGSLVGQMDFRQALDMAEEQGLDLVEVSKESGVSVYKIMDEGKWRYQQKKKQKHVTHSHAHKEMKFGMRIAEHDQEVKMNHIRKFLDKGRDVRIVVEMRGRERANPQNAMEKMNGLLSMLDGTARTDEIKKTNANISVMIHPQRGKNADQKQKVTGTS